MKTCPWCSERPIGSHIYCCSGKPSNISNREETKFLYLLHNYPSLAKKDVLKSEYQDKCMSLPDIRTKYGIDFKSTLFLLKYFNITTRNSKQAAGIARPKYKATCQKIYGTDNVLSKGTTAYKKRNKTVEDRYGVTNVFQIPDIISRITSDTFWLAKTGKTWRQNKSDQSKKIWDALCDDAKQEWLNKSICHPATRRKLAERNWYNSKLELKVALILDESSVTYTRQHFVGGKPFDFLLPNKTLLEVNGDYWHANPKIYQPNDLLHYTYQRVTAESIWKKDANKAALARAAGYKLVYIWELEMALKSNSEIAELLNQKLKEEYENQKNYQTNQS